MSRFELQSRVTGSLQRLNREFALAGSDIGMPERDAIHHHAVKRRLVPFRNDGLSKYRANCLFARHGYCREFRHRIENSLLRFCRG